MLRPRFETLEEALGHGEVMQFVGGGADPGGATRDHLFELAIVSDAAGVELLLTHQDGIVRVQDEVAGMEAVLAAAELRPL